MGSGSSTIEGAEYLATQSFVKEDFECLQILESDLTKLYIFFSKIVHENEKNISISALLQSLDMKPTAFNIKLL